jgi:pimeloyl-ACP methyl ester carboxylesterase
MISRLFHAWEHRLASITKDRVVRPFEWGIDWVPRNGHGADADGGGPEQRLRRWIDEAMRDTDAFFTPPPCSEFEFTASRPQAAAKGEGGTLRFPSAVVTPHAENNIVVARWFPARGESPPGRGRGRGRAIVILPQWNSDAEGHVGLARLLARCGVSALRLSLPYHDARMPPELTRADYIVSANVARTVQVCRQAVMDARRAVAWLAAQGFERIGILGTSLGSCLAMLTAAHEPLIRAQALNHVSPWFADVVWRGLSTRHVRQGLDGHIDLDRLRELWRPISPFSHLDRRQLADTRTLLVYARYDLTFPLDLSELLVQEFARRNLPHEVAVLPCGHYSTGYAPFKYLDGYVLTRFLLKTL